MNRNKVWEIIKKGKQILSFLCVIGLFVVGLRYCSRVLVNKTSIKKYEQFFHTDKRFDVLFLGSSHVINGVSPLDLFRDYGIASFNLSQHGNYVRSAYYLLAQILEIIESENRDMPKVVVLDVYADGESVPSLHNAWDGFPSSEIKRDMARNLANDKQTEMVLPLLFITAGGMNWQNKTLIRRLTNCMEQSFAMVSAFLGLRLLQIQKRRGILMKKSVCMWTE